jgi:KRAB domain-containing zinc finger protein
VRIEDKEYKFECKECDYGCDDQRNFNRHVDNHNGVRYPCLLCDFEATQAGALKRHVRNMHDKVKDFPCDECEKEFAQNAQLTIHHDYEHKKLHWVCSSCGKGFSKKGHCKAHIKRTTNTCDCEPVQEDRPSESDSE